MTTTTETAAPAIDWASLTDSELAQSYMICRTRKEVAEAAADKAEKIMDAIKAAMLARMNAQGSTGFKIEGVATITRTKKKVVSCGDWTQFLAWLFAHAKGLEKQGKDPIDAFAYLHRRVSVGTVEEWMAVNEGMPPPAINVQSEFDVSVRRA